MSNDAKKIVFCQQIREECEVLQMSDKQIKEIMSRLHTDLKKGLCKDTHDKATVKCWITYIQDLPNGKGNLYFQN